MMPLLCYICLILLLLSCCCSGLAIKPSTSIITGASGFVGRHVVYQLLQQRKFGSESGDVIICLVRDSKAETEQSYWDAHLMDMDESHRCSVKVLPYDMLDNGVSLRNALQASPLDYKICVYHAASVFGPTKDPVQTAHDNIKSAENVVEAMQDFVSRKQTKGDQKARLILTSSMAAVRATNQTPLNNKYYTNKDWNTLSTLDPNNWGSCYQYSKAESERRAWELVAKYSSLEMLSLCPSFVFGPPPPLPKRLQSKAGQNCSNSYSITLVDQWLSGKSQVQSRLCVDVRDVALAHVEAGRMSFDDTTGQRRYILSTEARLSSELTADAFKRAVDQYSRVTGGGSMSIDTTKIECDTNFDGGKIKIGDQEVECTDLLKRDFGITCRSVDETFYDMITAMLAGETF